MAARTTLANAATQAKRTTSHLQAVSSEAAEAAADDAHGLLASLSQQVGALATEVERMAEDRFEAARELAGEVAEASAAAAARARRQTAVAARAVRDDPVPALVALGVIGLVLALVAGRASRN